MEPVSPYWPSTVPASLWQLDLLRTPERRDFPFVGIQISGEFILAFLLGSVLICLFAWRRFAEPTYDVNAPAFRDFQPLEIWNLRDSASLRRAYTIYCISLIILYGSFAFFGRLIVQLSDVLSVSGLQIGVGTLDFNSWRWPLLLSLGISGFAPLINPLIPAELWLRRYAHEVVGIPTRIREKAVRIATLIDGRVKGTVRKIPDWVKDTLHSTAPGYLVLEKNLRIVVAWSYDDNFEWSDPEIRQKLNAYERQLREETEDTLAEFVRLTNTTTASDVQIRRQLTDCVRNLERCRDRFSLVLALYCEYGSRFERMHESDLKKGIRSRVVEKIEAPPTGLSLYWFAFVFLGYLLAINSRWHPLIFQAEVSSKTALASALFETFRIFLLLWLPLVTVSTFSTIVYGTGLTERRQNNRFLNRLIAMTFAAFLLATGGMVIIAFLYAALVSLTLTQMWQTLFDFGALKYFVSVAPVAAICFGIVNVVRSKGRVGPGSTLRWAVIAFGLSFLFLAFMIDKVSGLPCRVAEGSSVIDIPIWDVFWLPSDQLHTCFTNYELLNLIMIPATVSLSVLGLAQLELPKLSKWSLHRKLGKAVIVFMVGSLTALFFPNQLFATPRKVVIGFRTDIAPFSFSPAQKQQNEARPFSGYLADLCYEIFADSKYEVKSVPISDPAQRFDAIRESAERSNVGPLIDGEKIDVLCDAVTVRPNDFKRTRAGVFSPIVFVSGVSYLWRSKEGKNAEIGYLANSTAVQVAQEACVTDLLRLGSNAMCFESNKSACRVNRVEPDPSTGPTKSLTEKSEKPSYFLCPKPGHRDLVAWFCSTSGPNKVYFGDREIILGAIAAWKAEGRKCDNIRDPSLSFTYEPYALLISKADVELFAFVQLRIYELFSHRSGAEALFYKWFPRQTMSEPSAWLFNLNAVMQADELLIGPKTFPSINRPAESPSSSPYRQ